MLVVLAGRRSVLSDRLLVIAGHFQQMRPHRVKTMMILHAAIGIEDSRKQSRLRRDLRPSPSRSRD
jgi:hypothetical protein